MDGIRIRDEDDRGRLRFDLKDVLAAFPDVAKSLIWRPSHVEALGSTATELHAVADRQGALAGDDLVRLADGILQVIDGDFEGFAADGSLVCRIYTVDSTFWDVFSTLPGVLNPVRARFTDTEDVTEDLWHSD